MLVSIWWFKCTLAYGSLSCVINMILTDIHVKRGSFCLHINHLDGQVWLMVLKLVCRRMSCPEGSHSAEVSAVCFRFVLRAWLGSTVCGSGRHSSWPCPQGVGGVRVGREHCSRCFLSFQGGGEGTGSVR